MNHKMSANERNETKQTSQPAIQRTYVRTYERMYVWLFVYFCWTEHCIYCKNTKTFGGTFVLVWLYLRHVRACCVVYQSSYGFNAEASECIE